MPTVGVASVCARVCSCQFSNPNCVEHQPFLTPQRRRGEGSASLLSQRVACTQRLSPLQQLITAPGLRPRLVRLLEPEPRKQQDWILMCLQGRLAHLLTAWGGDTLLLSSKVRVGVGVRVWVRTQGDYRIPHHRIAEHLRGCREQTGGGAHHH
jgi:hypothetical protein